jgi:hypothetical protein
LQSQQDRKISSTALVQILELEKHVRELQARLLSVDQDNNLLRANVDESDYWIYDRGPIQQELQELRSSEVTSTMEINRLTRENVKLHDDLRRAEAVVPDAGRRHSRHEAGHPPPERASARQTFVNNMWVRSLDASRQRSVAQNNDQVPRE